MTRCQVKLLEDLIAAGGFGKFYRPNRATVNSCKKHGWVTERYIGIRATITFLTMTDFGRESLARDAWDTDRRP